MVGFAEFAERFNQQIALAEGVDVRVPEDSALIGLATDLVPRVTHLLHEGVGLLTTVEQHYSTLREIGDPLFPAATDSLSDIGLMFSSELAVRDVIDLAFFARTDLRAAHEALVSGATRNDGILSLASNCEAGLRRLRKALVSVESAIYEFEDRKAPERHWFDVKVSLQIRRLYWNLRRETGGETVDDDALERRLRAALYRIVAFRELSVYPFLRVDDRVEMRQLLKRILDWLNGEQRNSLDGRRLWQDLSAFAEILVQVSHREELRDYDRQVVMRAIQTLFRHPYSPPTSLPAELKTTLETLLGLDSELDRLITAETPPPVEAWREPLERLQATLRPRRNPLKAPPELWLEG